MMKKMMKKTACLILIVLLSALLGTVLTSLIVHLIVPTAYAETMVCIVDSHHYVNVRTGPATSSSANGRKIHGGDEIEVVSVSDDGWITIDWNGVNAYVQAVYFEAKLGAEYIIEANGRVRWRETPGGKIGGYYQPGEAVTVDAYAYGTDGKMWGRIGNHYVSMDFLTPYETEDEKEFYSQQEGH